MVEKSRVHGFPHDMIAAEREGDIAHPSADLAVGEIGLDPAGGLNEIDRVVVVLLHARRHGQDVGVKNNVLRLEADVLRQDPIGPCADLDLAFQRIGLPRLVEGHDDHRRAIAMDQPGALLESLLPFFQTDGIDHGLARHALEPRLNHGPLRAVDHDRHARDIQLRGHQVQEGGHGRL